MPLPWVSREAYEAVKAVYEAERTEKQSLLARYEALQALVIERGLQPEPKADNAPAVKLEPKEPSALELAIQEEAAGDPRLARYFRKEAARMRKEGKSDGDIIDSIRSWVTTEDSNQQAG